MTTRIQGLAQLQANSQPLTSLSDPLVLRLACAMGVPVERIQSLASCAHLVSLSAGQSIVTQHHYADRLYLLIAGRVDFTLQVNQSEQPVQVASITSHWTPMGWSGFREPHRYAISAAAAEPSLALAWSHAHLAALFAQDAELGERFLGLVVRGATLLLADVRERLAASLRRTSPLLGTAYDGEREDVVTNSAPPALSVLRSSTFFSIFDEPILERLARSARVRYFCRGETLVRQCAPADTLEVLASGKTEIRYLASGAVNISLGSLDVSGQMLSWQAALGNERHGSSVLATRDGALLELSQTALEDERHTDQNFGVALMLRLLWLVSRHLRAARTQLISESFDQELLAVRSIIEQNCTSLSVASPLHKLPHLLEHPVTLDLAFQITDTVRRSGSPLEAHIAASCAEVLRPVRAEQAFFSNLQDIYQCVISTSRDVPSVVVRRRCAEKFRLTFARVPHAIVGREHLPKSAGHIYVFNHLKNHEYNTLPNNFQLTLDSHFISSMLLLDHYGDPGVRVVRKSRAAEYGHQDYYDRLGHISVYTRESDQPEAPRDERLREFVAAATQYLQAGVNLIIAPEGTSKDTEQSPGEFKTGAFRLALAVEPEPLIVPVAVANFDRRLNHTAFGLVVKPPFRVSDRLDDPTDPTSVGRLVRQLQTEYRQFVREAAAAADSCWDAGWQSARGADEVRGDQSN